MPDSTESQDLFAIMRTIRMRKARHDINPDDEDDAEAKLRRRCDELESKTRRRGTLLLVSGMTLFALTMLLAGRLIALAPDYFYKDPVRLAGTLVNFVAFIALSAVLTSLGITEKLAQPDRAIHRQTSRIAPENAQRLDRLAVALEGLLEREQERDERLARIEGVIEKVPQYPEAVQDGWDLARGVAGNEGRF